LGKRLREDDWTEDSTGNGQSGSLILLAEAGEEKGSLDAVFIKCPDGRKEWTK
jgi:hypothetical protein